MNNDEIREIPEVKAAIKRLITRYSEDDDVDMGIWVNPKTLSIFTADSSDPIAGCILVYSIVDGKL